MVGRIIKLFAPLLALSLMASCANAPAPTAGLIPLDYLPAVMGDYFRLNSNVVGRPYHIYVHYPEAYREDPLFRQRAHVRFPKVNLSEQ